jgi:SAM-dependent methyltransferase
MENKEFKNELDASFWNQRWATGQTGWDIGYASPPITTYMEQYQNKNAAILIPGCGNAYEAEYLAANDFTNITLVDISAEAVAGLKEKFKASPQVKIICEDFFQHQGKYDLIIEQTFFCAQVKERRHEYVRKMAALLNDNGQLTGILFGVHFENPGPPFGGDKEEYITIFGLYFQIKKMEPCYNSIAPRSGTELFIQLIKK